MAGNEEGIKRQVMTQGGPYYDGMMSDYVVILGRCMSEHGYASEDVEHLHARMKGFLQSLKTPAPRTLYISDCHFYHNRLSHVMDNRGFSGFEEMNAYMVTQWNQKVHPKDTVYILGDFSISRAEATAKIIEQLNGKLHLIRGNHDRFLEDRDFDRSLFQSVDDYLEIRDDGRRVILSHYPLFCYNGQYRRDKQGKAMTYMLYGHVHDTHDEVLINRFIMETRATKALTKYASVPEPIPCNMINCFCMFSKYQPMTLNEWIVIDGKRRSAMMSDV